VVVSGSYLEAIMRTTPTCGAQNGCYGVTGCVATGPRKLKYMIESITQRFINFKIGTYLYHEVLVTKPNLVVNRSKI